VKKLYHFGNKHEIFTNDSPSSIKKGRVWGLLKKSKMAAIFKMAAIY